MKKFQLGQPVIFAGQRCILDSTCISNTHGYLYLVKIPKPISYNGIIVDIIPVSETLLTPAPKFTVDDLKPGATFRDKKGHSDTFTLVKDSEFNPAIPRWRISGLDGNKFKLFCNTYATDEILLTHLNNVYNDYEKVA